MGFQKGHKGFRKSKPNKIIYQDNIKTVFLTESLKYGNHEIIIDTEDWNRIKQYRWYIHYMSNKCYVYADKWENNKRSKFKLHRLIMNVNDPNIEIDHHFGNTLDNRKSELRICTRKENAQNVKIRKNNTSGFKGVTWDKLNKKWRTQITKNQKRIHIGLFKDKFDAAYAYNIAAMKYFGEFACLNKLQEDHVVYN